MYKKTVLKNMCNHTRSDTTLVSSSMDVHSSEGPIQASCFTQWPTRCFQTYKWGMEAGIPCPNSDIQRVTDFEHGCSLDIAFHSYA